jgi:hypothetical protein
MMIAVAAMFVYFSFVQSCERISWKIVRNNICHIFCVKKRKNQYYWTNVSFFVFSWKNCDISEIFSRIFYQNYRAYYCFLLLKNFQIWLRIASVRCVAAGGPVSPSSPLAASAAHTQSTLKLVDIAIQYRKIGHISYPEALATIWLVFQAE